MLSIPRYCISANILTILSSNLFRSATYAGFVKVLNCVSKHRRSLNYRTLIFDGTPVRLKRDRAQVRLFSEVRGFESANFSTENLRHRPTNCFKVLPSTHCATEIIIKICDYMIVSFFVKWIVYWVATGKCR